MGNAAAERTIWIAAPRDKVWQAVTEAQQLDRWYAPGSTWDIPALQVGATLTFNHRDQHSNKHTPLRATIETLDPLTEFAMRWQPDASNADLVLVTSLLLADDNDGTRVTIRETGYDVLADSERQDWIDGTNAGYGMSMTNLKALLEGQPIPHTTY